MSSKLIILLTALLFVAGTGHKVLAEEPEASAPVTSEELAAPPPSSTPSQTREQVKENHPVTKVTKPAPDAEALSVIRGDALREKAQALGAQAGLVKRSSEIFAVLTANEKNLDRLFNLGPLVIDGKVLPPVVTEARDATAMDETDVIRTSERIYRIDKQERFFMILPTWRDFLFVGLQPKPAEVLHQKMMPRDENEKKTWDISFDQGWKLGVNQADAIFFENISRLEKEYTGMIRYLLLCAKGMISRPIVATNYSLVTGDKKEMAVNDVTHMITEKSGLTVDSKQWNPVIHYKTAEKQ